MHTFKDTAGREWKVDIHVTAVKQVRNLLHVNLLELMDDECALLKRMTTDPVLLVDVVYVVCKSQADEVGISDEQFGRAMAGDPIEAAYWALMEGLADFFSDPGKRGLFKMFIQKLRTAAGSERKKSLDAMAKLSALKSSSLSGGSLESSDSTLALSHSGNCD